MKKIIYLYSFNFLKTIVYMLQSTEYKVGEYIKWIFRTDDFSKIMKRSNLVLTKKAKLLLLIAFVIRLIILLFVLFIIYNLQNIYSLIIAFSLFIISPYIVSFAILIPLFIGKIIFQKPYEKKMIYLAKNIILNQKALKIAIAGSYGKTTAKEILQIVLSQGKKVAYTPGNMNTPIGISRFVQNLDGDEDVIIFELGEEKVGDIRRLCDLVVPDMGIITGINEAHLSSFGSLENTVNTIFELQDFLKDRVIYKNVESELVYKKVNSKDPYLFSKKGTGDWKVSDIKNNINGLSFLISNGLKKIKVKSGLIGVHNIGILSVAVSIADSVGLSIKQIEQGLSATKPFEHRMQPKQVHGAWIIDDTYNGNSEGISAGLDILKNLEAKRKIYVTPGLVEQGHKTKEVHEKIGMQIADVADVVYLMKNSVTEYICNGLKINNFKGELNIIDNPLDFYINIEHYIVSGDVVLMQNDWTDNYA